jgi:hypothetical protein
VENLPEPEPPILKPNNKRLLLINGVLLGLVALLMLAASQKGGFLGGLKELVAIFGLMIIGGLVNLVQAVATKGSSFGYLLMAMLYGAVALYFYYGPAFTGKPNPGG